MNTNNHAGPLVYYYNAIFLQQYSNTLELCMFLQDWLYLNSTTRQAALQVQKI